MCVEFIHFRVFRPFRGSIFVAKSIANDYIIRAMKRLKLAAIAFAFVGLLASCGEDTIMEEIIADTALNGPASLETDRDR